MKRTLLAVLVALPVAASAQSSRAAASASPAASARPSSQVSMGGLIGYETGTFDGFGLRLDAELPLRRVQPKLTMSGVGSIGVTRMAQEWGYGDWDTTVLKLVPALRFTLPASPQLSIYFDGGLGIYYAKTTYDTRVYAGYWYLNAPVYAYGRYSGSSTGIMMRVGAGAALQVSPQVKLIGEAALNPYLGGDVGSSTFSLMFGAMFSLR